MSLAPEQYVPSGKWGNGLIVIPLVAIPATIPLGVAYAYLNVYNPLMYVQCLATFFYGWSLGWVVAWAAVRGKCRNPRVTGGLGALLGLAGLYVAWASFTYAFLSRQGQLPFDLVDCLFAPSLVYVFAQALAKQGWYSLGSSGAVTPSGIVLVLFWVVEGLMVVGAAAYAAYTRNASLVFCEDCGAWCAAEEDVARAEVPSKLDSLCAGDLEKMAAVPAPKFRAPSYVSLDKTLCAKCGNMGTYQLAVVTRTIEKGKEKLNKEYLTPHLLLTPESVGPLSALIARGKRAPVQKPGNKIVPPEQEETKKDPGALT